MNVNDVLTTGHDANQISPTEETPSNEKQQLEEPCCDLTSFLIESTAFLMESRKVIAFKDSQIETLEHYLDQKETQLVKLEDMNRILMNKLESASSSFVTQSNTLLTKSQEQQEKLISEMKETISSEKIDRLSQAVEKAESIEKKIVDDDTKKWQKDCQSIMLDMAKSMKQIESKVK